MFLEEQNKKWFILQLKKLILRMTIVHLLRDTLKHANPQFYMNWAAWFYSSGAIIFDKNMNQENVLISSRCNVRMNYSESNTMI